MRIVTSIVELREAIDKARRAGKRIGLVPTMGALHDGHLSLMRCARRETDFVVVSIFVNPTQFGPTEDFSRYPRDLDGDAAKTSGAGADLIFAPEAAEMYPPGFATRVVQDSLTKVLEGKLRPGHFEGVCTVCAKLFNLVGPDAAYFGRKDYQQSQVIRRMVRDLNLPIEIRVLPTVREEDGLAMSSRNAYLKPEERRQALCLSRSLQRAREMIDSGERRAEVLEKAMKGTIGRESLARIDYAVVVDAESLEPIERIEREAVALLAVRFGATRLIDNALLPPVQEGGK